MNGLDEHGGLPLIPCFPFQKGDLKWITYEYREMLYLILGKID